MISHLVPFIYFFFYCATVTTHVFILMNWSCSKSQNHLKLQTHVSQNIFHSSTTHSLSFYLYAFWGGEEEVKKKILIYCSRKIWIYTTYIRFFISCTHHNIFTWACPLIRLLWWSSIPRRKIPASYLTFNQQIKNRVPNNL